MAGTDASQSPSPESPSWSAQPEDLASVLEGTLSLHVSYANEKDEIQYCSPIVTLIVGPEELVMTAHKEVLTKFNSFFATCLMNGCFKEGMENVIKLPHEEPQNILKILSFLYAEDPFSVPLTLTEVINRYILADKYCLEEMASRALDRVVSQWGPWTVGLPSWSHFEQLKAAGLQGGIVWSTLMGVICTKLINRNQSYGGLDLESLLADGLESDSSAAIDLIREISTQVTQLQSDEANDRANGWCE